MPDQSGIKNSNFLPTIFGIATLIVVTTAGFFAFSPENEQNKQNKQEEVKGIQDTNYNTQTEDPYLIVYMGKEGKTALELLKEKEAVIVKSSSLGEYVDEINGIKGGNDNKYWIFYVNGEMGEVGADSFETKNTDIVEWRFE